MSNTVNMNTNKKWLSKKLLLFVPPVLAAVVMLAVFFANGIYPFGEGSVVYNDMTQCDVPTFYAAWDALHGDGGLLLNWNTASGIFVQGVLTTVLSPLNLLFFLVCPRGMILESMSFFIMLKIMLCAFTAMLFFSRKFKIGAYWQILFSLMYAFNAYILQYFVNTSWLEIVAAFPLVFLSLDYLFRERKITPYVLILTYCLMTQLYISYMIYIYLFLVVGLYIIMVIPKDIRKTSVLNFGIGSVMALFLSAFSALPSYFAMTSSSRYQSVKGYWDIVSSSAGNPATKLGMLTILTALPLAIMFLLVFKLPREKKKIGFCILAVMTCAVPVFFENVNLMWHMGSYVLFSMRFAFMLHLTLLTCSCYAIERFGESLVFRGRSVSAALSFVASLFVVSAAVWAMLNKIYTEESSYNLIDKTSGFTITLVFVLLFVFFVLSLRFGIKKLTGILIAAAVIFETGFYANRAFSVGKPRQFEYSLDFITDCEAIYDELYLPDDNITRIKNADASLNTNYPLITGYPSMSNFTHFIPLEIKKSMISLGYSYVYTRVLDTGGTLFTDALLGYKYTICSDIISDDEYTFEGTAGYYFIYKNNISLPFGVVAGDEIASLSIYGSDALKTNNSIARCVLGEELFDYPEYSRFVGEENEFLYRTATYTVKIEGSRRLYAAFPVMRTRKCLRILVNGEPVSVPSLDDPVNDRYSTRFNNGLLYLGSFEDEYVTVDIDFLNESVITPETINVSFAALDTERLSMLCKTANGAYDVSAGPRSLTAKVKSENGGDCLFLPVANDKGWECSVNGERVEIKTALGAFMAIKLRKGVNTVELRFMPRGMRAGIALSLIALLALAAVIVYNRKRTIDARLNKWYLEVLEWSYIIAVSGAYSLVYLVPMAIRIYNFILSRL